MPNLKTKQRPVHLTEVADDAATLLMEKLQMKFSPLVRNLLVEAAERVKRAIKKEKTDEPNNR